MRRYRNIAAAKGYWHTRRDVVVIHLCNNGTFTAGQFDEIMRIVAGEEKVVFVKGEKA